MADLTIIKRGYATVFIDYEGDSLEDELLTHDEIQEYYYDNGGWDKEDNAITDKVLPWNIYLIVPQEVFTNEKDIAEFKANTKFCRKYVMPEKEISDYVNRLFPELSEKKEMGEVYLEKVNEYAEYGFLLKNSISSKSDIYISSDFKYHEFFDAENTILIADIGHYESEQFTPEIFYEIISNKFPTFALYLTEINTNPVNYF